MRLAIKGLSSIRPGSTGRWPSSASVLVLHGRARLNRRRILRISSSESEFEGYRQTRSNGCEVLAIIKGGQGARQLDAGEEGEVILDHTPFYAESGGQVGDRGWLYSDDHNTVVADVKGCYYPIQGVRAHQVVMESPPNENRVGWGTLRIGDKVDAVVNTDIRQATKRNHTATHLLPGWIARSARQAR